jgi:thioredoxin 2
MKKYTKEEVFDLIESGSKVVIDFWAPWCGPCVSFSPTFEKVSEKNEFQELITFVKVNVDEEAEIASKYSIRNIPTIIFFDKGTQKSKKIGGLSESQFSSFLTENLS